MESSACLYSCQASSQDVGGDMQQLRQMQHIRQIQTEGCLRYACILLAALQCASHNCTG